MTINLRQFEHLNALQLAHAIRKYDPKTRREWQWKPWFPGPMIRPSTFDALCSRRLARWIPRDDEPGFYCITQAGRDFLRRVRGT